MSTHDSADRTFEQNAYDVWRSLVVALNLRWSAPFGLHVKHLRLRWLLMALGVGGFVDAVTSFVPMSTPHLLQAGLSLWLLGMATAWNPPGSQPWWRDPDERAGRDSDWS